MLKRFPISIFFVSLLFCENVFAEESLKINLQDAINLALKNNRAIEQSNADRETARWNLSTVRRSSGLRFSWSSSANKIGGRYYGDARASRNYIDGMDADYREGYFDYYNKRYSDYPQYQSETSNSLSLSIPLYTGGSLESQIKSANYNLNYADLILENSRQEVKWKTAQAYYQVLQYADLMNVRQEEIKNYDEHLRTVQVQYEVGTVALNDVLATNVQIANSKQALNSARASYENAISTLNNIMGLPVNTNLIIDENLSYTTFEETENFCMEYALEHRPDGIAANYAAKSSGESINMAKSGMRPNISAVVSGSITGEGAFKADHSNGQERWTAGVQMNWDIFDNNVTSAKVNQAKSAYIKAESQAKQQIEQIRLEVHNAYTTLRISEQNIKITADAVKQAQEQYLIAKVRYEEGVDTNIVVVDAQDRLTQARTNYYSALYAYNASRAQLEKAMGVPIETDAAIYAAAVDEGKIADKALKMARLSK